MPINLYETKSNKLIQAPDAESVRTMLASGQAGFGSDQDVPMMGPDGELYTVKGSDASAYIFDKGFTPVGQEEMQAKAKAETYSTPAQKALTTAESVLSGATVGLGGAASKKAIDIVGGKEAGSKYAEAMEARREENPLSTFAGETVGILADPFGTGAAISGAAKVIGKSAGVVGEAATALKVPKILTAPLTGKMAQRALEFGAEGAAYSAGFETGRQLEDDKPINAEAILDSGKHGLILGGALGGMVGATELAAASALSTTKNLTKKYLDKITGASEEARGEIFKESPTMSLEKNIQEKYGRNQKSIKLQETENGNFSYNDGKRQGVYEALAKDASGLDLTSPSSIDELGKNIKIDNLNTKLKFKHADEPLTEFLAKERNAQIIQDQLSAYEPYMNDGERGIYNKIKNARNAFDNLINITENDIGIMDSVRQKEMQLFNFVNPEYAEIVRGNPSTLTDIYKKDLDYIKRNLSKYDFIKDFGESGAKELHIYNENILPNSIVTKAISKGITPVSFEAKELSSQLGMTAKKMEKMGATRLNDVSEFILGHYPKEGSLFKKATTSIDYIANAINDTKTKAINELEETINQALNIGGSKQRITNGDIAKYIETTILPQYTDVATGNPIAGLERQFNQIQDFANGYKNNGFKEVFDKYGVKQKNYYPLDVKQIREARIRLDKIAEFSTESDKAVVKAARDLRFWLEDQVIEKVGSLDKSLVDRYVKAKSDYRNALDSEKIISLASKKASQKSGFSLLYSGVSSLIGGAVGGSTGAIAGGLIGGAAKNMLSEYSGTLSIFLARDLAKNVEKYENTISKTAKAFFSPVEKAAKVYTKLPIETDADIAKKDMSRLTEELNNREEFVQKFVDKNDYLFSNFPLTSKKVLETSLRARDFLITKIPRNPYAGNPLKEDQWMPSPSEIMKYMRYREAVNKPSLILEQIKNGYVTPEASEALSNVYPETKQALAQKFLETLKKGSIVPVEKRMEIYKVFGIKLDSFNDPSTFIEYQSRANSQAVATKNENDGNIRPNNAFKIKKKDLSLGNSLLKE